MAVQIGDAHDIHSKKWYANQESIEKKWNQQQAVAEYEGRDLEAEEIPVVHRQTIDQSELYNGMAVQLGDAHDIHSKNWYANQAALENKWNQEQAIAEYEGDAVEAQEVHRQTIDQSELYNGMAVQLGDIHSPAYKAIMAEQE